MGLNNSKNRLRFLIAALLLSAQTFLGLWICFSEGPLQRLQDREREAKCVKLRTVLQPELEAGNCHLCLAVSVLGTYHGEIKLENHRIIKEKTSENQHF